MIDTGAVALAFVIWAYNTSDWEAPLKPSKTTPSVSFSVGQTWFEWNEASLEYRLRYNTGRKIGVAQIVLEGAITDHDAFYAGLGGRLQHDFEYKQLPLFVTATAIAGYYDKGNDADAQSELLFRTDVEFGLRFGDDNRLGLVWDHRSHGYTAKLVDRDALNPGIESLSLRYTRDF